MKTLSKSLSLLLAGLVVGCATAAVGQSTSPVVVCATPREPGRIEGRYEGTWVTTKNKKLDGTMMCDVKQLSDDRWKGRFWGEWQHVPFDYTVEFEREKPDRPVPATPPREHTVRVSAIALDNPVVGTATIDGAHYDWRGSLTRDEFTIVFTGSRYEGHAELKRAEAKKSTDKE